MMVWNDVPPLLETPNILLSANESNICVHVDYVSVNVPDSIDNVRVTGFTLWEHEGNLKRLGEVWVGLAAQSPFLSLSKTSKTLNFTVSMVI